jgi:hypothetical protein
MLLCHTQCVCCGTRTFFLRGEEVVAQSNCQTCGRRLSVAHKPFGEMEWLSCDRAADIVLWRDERTTPRKLRLFCCAVSRAVLDPDRMTDVAGLSAIEVCERYADGLATRDELLAAGRKAQAVIARYLGFTPASGPYAAMNAADEDLRPERVVASVLTHPREDRAAKSARLAALFRDVVGNPFRPLPVLDGCVRAFDGGVVEKLARDIYDEGAFDRLPILGDALEEAGCADPFLLSHCHSGAEHTRGCWVVDLVLNQR